jgi:hypothetical protein
VRNRIRTSIVKGLPLAIVKSYGALNNGGARVNRIFRNSSMQMYSAEGGWEHPCEVRISDGSIAVSYQDGPLAVVYEGEEQGEGHYSLEAVAVAGRAPLHRAPNSEFLEGWWWEEGAVGGWRIQLVE